MNCIDGMKQLDDECIDLIFTDPPYGKDGIYIYEEVSKEAKRILKNGGICIFYASDYWLDKTFPICMKYLDYFYLFHKINNRGTASIFPKKIFAGGKSILLFSKGKPKKMDWLNNVISISALEKESHPLNWQQIIQDAIKFIKTYSNEGDIVLDPCIGSGTTAIACRQLRRNFIGFEKDKEIYEIAINRVMSKILEDKEEK